MARKPHCPRNRPLSKGVMLLSKSKMNFETAKFKHVKKGDKGKKTEVKPFGKSTVAKKEQKDVKPKKGSKVSKLVVLPGYAKNIPKRGVAKTRPTPALRESIKPGTVLIVLIGKHRGQRVVFLKQLTSGLLLVTGPYKINGVPLSRVHQSFVIATKTVVDISDVKIDAKVNDDLFVTEKKSKKKAQPDQFFESKTEEKKTITPERKQLQKTIDAPLVAAVRKVPQLDSYLRSLFTLNKGQYPHEMVF